MVKTISCRCAGTMFAISYPDLIPAILSVSIGYTPQHAQSAAVFETIRHWCFVSRRYMPRFNCYTCAAMSAICGRSATIAAHFREAILRHIFLTLLALLFSPPTADGINKRTACPFLGTVLLQTAARGFYSKPGESSLSGDDIAVWRRR